MGSSEAENRKTVDRWMQAYLSEQKTEQRNSLDLTGITTPLPPPVSDLVEQKAERWTADVLLDNTRRFASSTAEKTLNPPSEQFSIT